MATLGIASREFSLNEIGNALTVPIDSIGYDCEFGSDGREVDRGHNFTLGQRPRGLCEKLREVGGVR